MAKRTTKTAIASDTLPYLYEITTDYLVNPTSDNMLKGDYTRAELEAFGIDVDELVKRGILEKTYRVRQ